MASVYSNPQALDILLSVIIGIAFGALITALIFILVIKKRWEKKWKYHNRVKSISQIRLPQIAFDDASLSKNALNNTVFGSSTISDKRFLERVLSEEPAQPLDANEVLFSSSAEFVTIPMSNGPTDGALNNEIVHQGRNDSESAATLSRSNTLDIDISGSTLDSNQREISTDDDDIPLGIQLHTINEKI